MNRSTPTVAKKPLLSLPVAEAYDQWASIYDTDGNFLQVLDDLELSTLLPPFLSSLRKPSSEDPNQQQQQQQRLLLVDLGCGTGRNTLKLLDLAPEATIVGLELSPKMLNLARAKVGETWRGNGASAAKPEFYHFDMLDPSTSSLPAVAAIAARADAVMSTLVLEHVPLPIFFQTAASMLKLGGKLLVTNMHPCMGAISQAGFVDPVTGTKVQTTSFVHGIEETVHAAEEAGLRVLGEVRERGVDEHLAEKLGRRGAKWIGVDCWFRAVFEKVV